MGRQLHGAGQVGCSVKLAKANPFHALTHRKEQRMRKLKSTWQTFWEQLPALLGALAALIPVVAQYFN